MLLGILAVNLDLPLCVFLLDASETNYSGFRGAIDQARQRWREIQSWMMGSFHGPVYECCLAVAVGSTPGAVTGAVDLDRSASAKKLCAPSLRDYECHLLLERCLPARTNSGRHGTGRQREFIRRATWPLDARMP